ncbi:MAG: hypothetical protein JWR27_2416 [Aeromicrobium sp.]|nr:hypothetical protein [Aeromicrobium sp.]
MPAPVESSYLRPAFLTALVGAAISLGVAAFFVLLAQGVDGLRVAGFLRATGRTWLVAMGSGIDAGPVSIGLVPVGATLLCVVAVVVAVFWVATEPVHERAAFAAATAGAYGTIAAIVSAATNSGDVQTSVVRAALVAFVVGGVGAVWGVGRRHGDGEDWWFTASQDVRIAVRASVPAILAVLGAAATIVAVLMFAHVSRIGDLWASLDAGTGGGIALGVGDLLAIPTLVLWTASALLGPGFALGTSTSVDLTGAQLGQVPGFPVLGVLPMPGEFPGWVFVLGLVPLLAGMLAGWRVEPASRDGVLARIALGAGAGAVAGLALGVLVGISGGAVGPGRMADAGPPPLTPLLVAVPVLAAGGALGAALAHYRGGRASRPSDTSASGRPRLWKRHQSPSVD